MGTVSSRCMDVIRTFLTFFSTPCLILVSLQVHSPSLSSYRFTGGVGVVDQYMVALVREAARPSRIWGMRPPHFLHALKKTSVSFGAELSFPKAGETLAFASRPHPRLDLRALGRRYWQCKRCPARREGLQYWESLHKQTWMTRGRTWDWQNRITASRPTPRLPKMEVSTHPNC